MSRKRDQAARPALELIDGAVHLLRSDPVRLLAPYYIGACPFVLAVLFFWADMSHDAFAPQRLGAGAWLLTLLFFWMKAWQALFCAGIWGRLGSGNPEPWSAGMLARMIGGQIILQPLGLFLIPLSVILMLPMFYVYPYYQCVCALGGLQGTSVPELRKRALKQTFLWQTQWVSLGMALQLIIGVVFINVMSLLFLLPQLFKMFTGMETQLTLIGEYLLLNSTFVATCACVTYLLLDPMIKTLCVIRCFQGEARITGADLKTELRQQRALRMAAMLAVILLAGLGGGTNARAQGETPAARQAQIDPATLNSSIDEVLTRRAYSWRMPRPVVEEAEAEKGAIASFFDSLTKMIRENSKKASQWMGRAIENFVDWLFRGRKTNRQDFSTDEPRQGFGAVGITRVLIVLVCVVALVLIVGALISLVRGRREVEAEAAGPALTPDIADESVGAEQLPVDGWMAMFTDLLNRGELRLAMRALVAYAWPVIIEVSAPAHARPPVESYGIPSAINNAPRLA